MEVDTNDKVIDFSPVRKFLLPETYRVETFIIPMNNKVFRSTDELYVNSGYQNDEIGLDKDKTDDLKISHKNEIENFVQKSILNSTSTKLDNISKVANNGEEHFEPVIETEVKFKSADLEENKTPPCDIGEVQSKHLLSPESNLSDLDHKQLVVTDEASYDVLRVSNDKSIDTSEEFADFNFTAMNDKLADDEGSRSFGEKQRLKSKSHDPLPSSRLGSELTSITEGCEVLYGSHEELCHHGNRNGCTVNTQSPSQVSEEIFKENWMQRLEFLRQRVTLLKEKEIVLQERERLLFKKEKELRILERLAREKIQKADLYLKRYGRNSLHFERELVDIERCSNVNDCFQRRLTPPPQLNPGRWTTLDDKTDSHGGADSRNSNYSTQSKGSNQSNRLGLSRYTKDGATKDSIDINENFGRIELSDAPKHPAIAVKPPRQHPSTVTAVPSEHFERFRSINLKSLHMAKSHIIPNDASYPKINDTNFIVGNGHTFGDSSQDRCHSQPNSQDSTSELPKSRWSAYSSWRLRPRPKMTYDDLDSTLSADIGDSSFMITSKKLDPQLVQKPRLFTRSASERRPKSRSILQTNVDTDLIDADDKVLRKISENITAIAQNQGTTFQDYGSIDLKQDIIMSDHEMNSKSVRKEDKIPRVCASADNLSKVKRGTSTFTEEKSKHIGGPSKTSFWNEEASEWLRKKRQAYNLATKRTLSKDMRNKENVSVEPYCQTFPEKEKQSRKNKEKAKKFTIFR